MHVKMAEPEFSRPLAIDKIPTAGLEDIFEAREAERQKLAERFGLLELTQLKGKLLVKSHGNRTIKVTGKIIADVVQQCVVTLEPLPAHIEKEVDVTFAAPELLEGGTGPSDPNEEEMEAIINGEIDLGELAAQNLGIALDPYPRKAGQAFVEAVYGDNNVVQGPLAQLAELAKKPNKSK